MTSIRWFATWRTYGTWLPGEEGFIGEYRTIEGYRRNNNEYGFPGGPAMHGLKEYSKSLMVASPTLLNPEYARIVMKQLQQTCDYRNWTPAAIAVMTNHVHIVLATEVDVRSFEILRDLKSYCSRALNLSVGKGFKGKWWAEGGCVNELPTNTHLENAVEYTVNQEYPLVIWKSDTPLV